MPKSEETQSSNCESDEIDRQIQNCEEKKSYLSESSISEGEEIERQIIERNRKKSQLPKSEKSSESGKVFKKEEKETLEHNESISDGHSGEDNEDIDQCDNILNAPGLPLYINRRKSNFGLQVDQQSPNNEPKEPTTPIKISEDNKSTFKQYQRKLSHLSINTTYKQGNIYK